MSGTNRRDFINKALKLTAAGMVANPLTTLLNDIFGLKLQNSMNLFARSNVEYPPGIANCRDSAVKDAYYYLVKYGDNRANRFYTGFQMAQTILRDRMIGNDHYMTAREIRTNTPLIEPAYWFVCAKANIGPDRSIYPILKKRNPALYWFKEGLGDYFQQWIHNKGYNSLKKNIETEFLKSIFFAANYTETEVETGVKRYLKSNIKEREQKLKQIMKIYRSYEIDPTANKINDNYDKLLTAAWSSYFLTEHYFKMGGRSKKTMTMFNLENHGFKNLKDINSNKIDMRVRCGEGGSGCYFR